MSEIAEEMLQTTDKRVHEQLDMLVAGMQVQLRLATTPIWETIKHQPEKKRNKWLKEEASQKLRELGYSPGFLQRSLLLHIFFLYEAFYDQYTRILVFKEGTPLLEIQYSILQLAASFLDNQFAKEGLADVCAFLKNDFVRLKEELGITT